MQDYKRDFLRLVLDTQVLALGSFTLKSGRVSPYFFNAGLINTGESLARLGRAYASAIVEAQAPCDVLFGPAYKGIPLAAATAIGLAEHFGRSVRYAYNRKEVKDHGEGGSLVGGPLSGDVLIIDDVITAGTSVNASVELIRAAGARPAGVVIALDRRERGAGERSAVDEIRERYAMPVISILTLDDLLAYLAQDPAHAETLAAVQSYQDTYGV